MRRYQLITVFNKPAQYGSMVASFELAGFSHETTRFTPCDNSTENRFDPYAVIDSVATAADPEPYVIVCHQDVRLDTGDGIAQLDAVIARVEASDPDWAILGNAGVSFRRQARWWINDPGGQFRTAPVPESCISLDENFLVFQRRCAPRLTPGLRGFHLYGTDAVLNAALAGHRSFVVPFLLTHLSEGSPESPAFKAACAEFESAWMPRLTLGIVNTTCAHFVLSRWRPIKYLYGRFWRIRHSLAWCGVTFARRWWNLLGIGRSSSVRLNRRID